MFLRQNLVQEKVLSKNQRRLISFQSLMKMKIRILITTYHSKMSQMRIGLQQIRKTEYAIKRRHWTKTMLIRWQSQLLLLIQIKLEISDLRILMSMQLSQLERIDQRVRLVFHWVQTVQKVLAWSRDFYKRKKRNLSLAKICNWSMQEVAAVKAKHVQFFEQTL